MNTGWRRGVTAGAAGIGVLVAAAAAAGGGATGEPVLFDDFDDGVIDGRWLVIETNRSILTVVEENMRLELPAEANPGLDAVAGVAGNGWALDATDDFALRIDAHASVPPTEGDLALVVVLAFDVDLESVTVDDGLVAELGRDVEGPFVGYAVVREGSVTQEEYGPPPGEDVTFFAWYDAGTDTLSLSLVEFFDPEAARVFGLRTQSGSDRVTIFLGAFSDGVAPAVPGEDLHLDTFVVEDGTIVDTCRADLDGSGAVDFGDVLDILAAWGNAGGREDLDGNGLVDFGDVLEVLAQWGPCP